MKDVISKSGMAVKNSIENFLANSKDPSTQIDEKSAEESESNIFDFLSYCLEERRSHPLPRPTAFELKFLANLLAGSDRDDGKNICITSSEI